MIRTRNEAGLAEKLVNESVENYQTSDQQQGEELARSISPEI